MTSIVRGDVAAVKAATDAGAAAARDWGTVLLPVAGCSRLLHVAGR